MRLNKYLLTCLVTIAVLWGCGGQGEVTNDVPADTSDLSLTSDLGFSKLSEYGFFVGKLADMLPADGVVPYELNTPLFSDYAYKARFVKLPEGKAAKYSEADAFEFPEGTVLIKSFYYPHDMTDLSKGRRIMETRLLIREADTWKALPYIWNEAQTDATLEVAGGRHDVSWVNTDGKKVDLNYSVPNMNQCKGCHAKGNTMTPIGPKARNLNGDFAYADGSMNQLQKWQQLGILEGLPEKLTEIQKVPVWNDAATGSLHNRARAYLDINCAHCHTADGPGNTSGLHLDYTETDKAKIGYHKAPIAAGRGSGGLAVDIEPGDPEASIIWFRMNSNDPGIMMPELGRKQIHREGVVLIHEWITSMKE